MGPGGGDCGEVLHRLYHFLDGQLDDDRRSVIQGHLEACLDCLGAFDFEAELRQVIARRCRDRAPESLRVRIAMVVQHPPSPFDGTLGGVPPL